jgi:hypothetical protein
MNRARAGLLALVLCDAQPHTGANSMSPVWAIWLRASLRKSRLVGVGIQLVLKARPVAAVCRAHHQPDLCHLPDKLLCPI